MTEPRWTLQLTFKNGQGDSYHMAVDIGHEVARPICRLEVPCELTTGFDQAVEVLRRKEFRKDLFVAEATRLGKALAERMEDKEGWHGEDRAERLRDWGKP